LLLLNANSFDRARNNSNAASVTTSHHKTTTTITLHPFNGLFSKTTWVSQQLKGKPFWILLEKEMMGQQWHHLDHMQIICT